MSAFEVSCKIQAALSLDSSAKETVNEPYSNITKEGASADKNLKSLAGL